MKLFMRQHGEDKSLFEKVRTLINNQRAELKRRVDKRKKELGY